jgi:DNA-binding HxlR family transcriptional regulator
MVLLDVLGQRWVLRILWELRGGRLNFRGLQAACAGISPTVLNGRLKTLRALAIVDHDGAGYGLTVAGAELGEQLRSLSAWSERWAGSLSVADESG